MPGALRISVVVVSHGRPQLLRRALLGVSQMTHPEVEVIVVADCPGQDAARTLPFAARLKILSQDDANIAQARNAGLAAAGGEIVAFLDDDAVPEPTWAQALADAFNDPNLAAVTGKVLGRNGVSVQWGRMVVDPHGRDSWLADGAVVPDGRAVKLHGTNMAVRTKVLREIGGFDPAFAFFMDDTDLAVRLTKAQIQTAYVPDAVVHHGFAASTRRTEDRIPLSLFDIGASTAVFLRKHHPGQDAGPDLRQLESDQRARLMRLVRRRKIDSRKTRQLMESLMDGIAAGRTRPLAAYPEITAAPAFLPLNTVPTEPMLFEAAWAWSAQMMRQTARDRAERGLATTLFVFDPTPRKHKVTFTPDGWWEQTGGLFGPSDRTGRRLQPWRFADRVAAERARIGTLRGGGAKRSAKPEDDKSPTVM